MTSTSEFSPEPPTCRGLLTESLASLASDERIAPENLVVQVSTPTLHVQHSPVELRWLDGRLAVREDGGMPVGAPAHVARTLGLDESEAQALDWTQVSKLVMDQRLVMEGLELFDHLDHSALQPRVKMECLSRRPGDLAALSCTVMDAPGSPMGAGSLFYTGSACLNAVRDRLVAERTCAQVLDQTLAWLVRCMADRNMTTQVCSSMALSGRTVTLGVDRKSDGLSVRVGSAKWEGGDWARTRNQLMGLLLWRSVIDEPRVDLMTDGHRPIEWDWLRQVAGSMREEKFRLTHAKLHDGTSPFGNLLMADLTGRGLLLNRNRAGLRKAQATFDDREFATISRKAIEDAEVAVRAWASKG